MDPRIKKVDTPPPTATLYWRNGCGFCAMLMRSLKKKNVAFDEIVNIWDEPQRAADVRKAANGNETVPTVVIGDHALVNPSASAVVELLQTLRPDLVDQ